MRRIFCALLLIGCNGSFQPFSSQPDGGVQDVGRDASAQRMFPTCRIEGWTMDAFFSGNRIEGHRLEHGSCAFDGNCHSSSAARSHDHDLDLELPNAWSRLQGRRSFHAPCSDFLLLDPERPEASFFYMKLAGTQGACGDPMPGGELVSQDELDCVAAWILSNVPEPERGFCRGRGGAGGSLPVRATLGQRAAVFASGLRSARLLSRHVCGIDVPQRHGGGPKWLGRLRVATSLRTPGPESFAA